MNRKNRVFSFLLAILLLFSLGACGEVKKKAPAKKVDAEKGAVKGNDKKTSKEAKNKKDEKKPADSKNQKKEGKENKTESKTENKISKNQEDGKNEDTKKVEEEASSTNEEDEDVIEINEKLFLQKINDIYFNYEDYKDATVVVEGMFSYFQNMDGTEQRPVVYRNGPGCCGNDGWGGFFLIYDGDFPQENDWIRVKGKPIVVESEQGWLDLFLKVESLEVKEERGSEFVTH